MIDNAQKLMAAFSDLPDISPQYEEENPLWAQNRTAIRHHVKEHDIYDMLRWSTVESTMFTKESAYLKKEYMFLMEDNTDRWTKAMRESHVGNPYRFETNSTTSGNLVHQAYHIMQLEYGVGMRVSDMNKMVEFGGGYGAMCAIVRRLGFEGRYYIYDLPEFCLIQEYYLSQLGYAQDVYFLPVNDDYSFPSPPNNPDCLVSCFSLNEVNHRLRESFTRTVQADYIMIVMNQIWGSKDPDKSMKEFMSKIDNYKWTVSRSKAHQPHIYMIGELQWP